VSRAPRAKRHRWTADEIAILRREYPRLNVKVLAARLKMTLKQVYGAAHACGLARRRVPIAEHRAAICRLHGEGLSDTQIADRLGVSRSAVSSLRRRLGLPRNADALLEAQHRAIASQARTLKIRPGGTLRALGHRRFAEEHGWPAHLKPREVQILNALVRGGSMTRSQLAEAIGMRTDLIGGNGYPTFLRSSRGAGSYTANLQRYGLVTYLHRSRPSGRQGHGRLPGLYVLTPAALTYLEKRHGTVAKAQ
jgi:DNA-binding NarL/FixJ family response regulator